MDWTWDDDKDRENRRKHRVGFEVAKLVFDDPLYLQWDDPFPDEYRFRTIGRVGGVVLIVVHTLPDPNSEAGGQTGRIITARKAEPHERRAYEEGYLQTD